MRIGKMSVEQIALHLDLDEAELKKHFDHFFNYGKSQHPFLTEEQLNVYALRGVRTLYSARIIDAGKPVIIHSSVTLGIHQSTNVIPQVVL